MKTTLIGSLKLFEDLMDTDGLNYKVNWIGIQIYK